MGSLARSAIASFDTKYAYHFWRPYTAITRGDEDGNRRTQGDPNWQPLCVTPPFPEYNSAHAVVAGLTAELVAAELGDHNTIVVTSADVPTPRTYYRVSDAMREGSRSRVLCGIHYQISCDHGFRQGQQVSRYIRKRFMRPVRHHGHGHGHGDGHGHR